MIKKYLKDHPHPKLTVVGIDKEEVTLVLKKENYNQIMFNVLSKTFKTLSRDIISQSIQTNSNKCIKKLEDVQHLRQ